MRRLASDPTLAATSSAWATEAFLSKARQWRCVPTKAAGPQRIVNRRKGCTRRRYR